MVRNAIRKDVCMAPGRPRLDGAMANFERPATSSIRSFNLHIPGFPSPDEETPLGITVSGYCGGQAHLPLIQSHNAFTSCESQCERNPGCQNDASILALPHSTGFQKHGGQKRQSRTASKEEGRNARTMERHSRISRSRDELVVVCLW